MNPYFFFTESKPDLPILIDNLKCIFLIDSMEDILYKFNELNLSNWYFDKIYLMYIFDMEYARNYILCNYKWWFKSFNCQIKMCKGPCFSKTLLGSIQAKNLKISIPKCPTPVTPSGKTQTQTRPISGVMDEISH